MILLLMKLPKDLDIFISKIENRGFEYIDVKTLFKNNKIEESKEYVKAFETYYKRQMNKKNSLSKRDEYIDRLGKNQLIEILEWAVDIFPELNEKKRFKDILSSQTNLQYGKVKDRIRDFERTVFRLYVFSESQEKSDDEKKLALYEARTSYQNLFNELNSFSA